MKSIDEMTFSECLLYLRKKNKECSSQSKLADKTSISRYEIRRFECGEDLPTLSQLNAICIALNSDVLRKKGEIEIE